MFRSSTIIRELALNLAKVIFMLKHSVKLCRYLLCGCVAACCHTTVRYTGRPLTEIDVTRCCINRILPPDDVHDVVRNM